MTWLQTPKRGLLGSPASQARPLTRVWALFPPPGGLALPLFGGKPASAWPGAQPSSAHRDPIVHTPRSSEDEQKHILRGSGVLETRDQGGDSPPARLDRGGGIGTGPDSGVAPARAPLPALPGLCTPFPGGPAAGWAGSPLLSRWRSRVVLQGSANRGVDPSSVSPSRTPRKSLESVLVCQLPRG